MVPNDDNDVINAAIRVWQDGPMTSRCFRKKGSDPPVCGVHGVPLVQRQSSEYSVSSRVGDFVFLVCPVSGQVVD